MNNLSQVWSKRFNHYLNEVQKYMRFVFTGHLALVMVFVVGAVGYQYSEWLKIVDDNFPAEWLVAGIVGALLSFSRPITLLREPDQVYLLPLETKMGYYFKRALELDFLFTIWISISCLYNWNSIIKSSNRTFIRADLVRVSTSNHFKIFECSN